MNAEAALKLAVESPDYCALSGSRLYGTNTDSSDKDYRGFVLPPYQYLIGVKTFNDTMIGSDDHKIYSLKRFLDMILRGDPQNTELLFTYPDFSITCTEIGKQIIDLTPYLISNRIYARIMGYSYSEWRKAMGERLVIEDRTKDEEEIIAWIKNNKKWQKSRMDEFVIWMQEDKERKIVPSVKDLGAKRKAQFEEYGYGASSATHAIRLVGQLTELLSTGKITFPRPNTALLRDIRHGRKNKDEIQEIYEEGRQQAEKAQDHSVLADKPDEKRVLKEYEEIVINFLRTP